MFLVIVVNFPAQNSHNNKQNFILSLLQFLLEKPFIFIQKIVLVSDIVIRLLKIIPSIVIIFFGAWRALSPHLLSVLYCSLQIINFSFPRIFQYLIGFYYLLKIFFSVFDDIRMGLFDFFFECHFYFVHVCTWGNV